MTRWFIAALAAFLAVPSAARAETITFGTTSVLNNAAATALALPTFDTSLGTLNSVRLSLNYSATTLQVGVTNPYSYQDLAAVIVLSFMSMNTQGQTFGSIVDIQGGGVPVPPGQSVVVPIPFSAGSLAETLTTGLAAYTSAAGPTFQLTVENRIVFANGNMPLTVAGGTGIPFTQTVTYDYTPGPTPPVEPPPVPLPAAAWGGAALLAGLGTAQGLRARRLLRRRDF